MKEDLRKWVSFRRERFEWNQKENPLISAKYRETIDQLMMDYSPLTRKEEEKLEGISYARVMLNKYMPEELSETVNKLSHSVGYSLATAILLIAFGYSPTFNLDPTTVLVLQILFFALAFYFLARYMIDGILKIGALRKFDTKINELDRCQTFEELYDLL